VFYNKRITLYRQAADQCQPTPTLLVFQMGGGCINVFSLGYVLYFF